MAATKSRRLAARQLPNLHQTLPGADERYRGHVGSLGHYPGPWEISSRDERGPECRVASLQVSERRGERVEMCQNERSEEGSSES